jgi:hypothetical protein
MDASAAKETARWTQELQQRLDTIDEREETVKLTCAESVLRCSRQFVGGGRGFSGDDGAPHEKKSDRGGGARLAEQYLQFHTAHGRA